MNLIEKIKVFFKKKDEDFNWRQSFLDFGLWSLSATPLQKKIRELEWAEARHAIKNSTEFKKFKEWLVSWAFDYDATGKQQATNYAERCKYDGSADACITILRNIEISPRIIESLKAQIVELEEKQKKEKK